MNIKRILLFSLVLLMIVSSLNMVSAGDDDESYMTDCFVSAMLDDNLDWYINIQVYTNSSENCSGRPIFINVTDSSGNVKSYNLTTSPMYDEEFDVSRDGEVNITEGIKENETYTVSIYFPGDDKLPSMIYNETVNTTVDYPVVEEEDTDDLNTAPTEDTYDESYDSEVSSEPVVPRSTYEDPAIHGFFGTQGYRP